MQYQVTQFARSTHFASDNINWTWKFRVQMDHQKSRGCIYMTNMQNMDPSLFCIFQTNLHFVCHFFVIFCMLIYIFLSYSACTCRFCRIWTCHFAAYFFFIFFVIHYILHYIFYCIFCIFHNLHILFIYVIFFDIFCIAY